MRILKGTEWNNEIASVGYDAVTKIDNTDEVEVIVKGTCNANGWIEQVIEETGTSKRIYENGYFLKDGGDSIFVSKHIPEIDKLLSHLNSLL